MVKFATFTDFIEGFQTKEAKVQMIRALQHHYHITCKKPPFIGDEGMKPTLEEFVDVSLESIAECDRLPWSLQDMQEKVDRNSDWGNYYRIRYQLASIEKFLWKNTVEAHGFDFNIAEAVLNLLMNKDEVGGKRNPPAMYLVCYIMWFINRVKYSVFSGTPIEMDLIPLYHTVLDMVIKDHTNVTPKSLREGNTVLWEFFTYLLENYQESEGFHYYE